MYHLYLASGIVVFADFSAIMDFATQTLRPWDSTEATVTIPLLGWS